MPFGVSAGTAALAGGAIAGGGSILGGLIGSGGASSAADAQIQAARIAGATQQNMFNTTAANESPFLIGGVNALSGLEGALGMTSGGFAGQGQLNLPMLLGLAPGANPTQVLQSTPGYQWQFGQGEQAIQNSAAAKGGLIGGNTLTALQTYGQGMADQTWQQYLGNVGGYLGQLSGLAGAGQNAAANLGGFSQNAANGIANAATGAGAASAAGSVGTANAFNQGLGGATNAIGQGLSQYQLMQMLSNTPGTMQYNSANTSAYNNASAGVNAFNYGNPFSSVPS